MLSRRKFLGLVAAVPFLAPLLRAGCKAKCEAKGMSSGELAAVWRDRIVMIGSDFPQPIFMGFQEPGWLPPPNVHKVFQHK